MNVFEKYSSYYDVFYKDKDYVAEVDFIDYLIRQFADGDTKTILDMGCGTGGHALLLAEKGYDITGIDRSESMLAFAKEKVKNKGISVDFFQEDIRYFNLNTKFDTIIAMFAVMGYQTTNEDIEKAFSNISRHLNRRGLFFFDVWFGPAVLTEKPSDKVLVIENGDEKVIRITKSKLNIMEHTVDVHFHIMRIKGNAIIEQTEETHLIRFFFPREIEYFLKINKLKLIDIFPFLRWKENIVLSTWNVSIVAQAISEF